MPLTTSCFSGGEVDADGDGVVDVPRASETAAVDKWVVKHDIIGSPMQMVAVPTHFFKVTSGERRGGEEGYS